MKRLLFYISLIAILPMFAILFIIELVVEIATDKHLYLFPVWYNDWYRWTHNINNNDYYGKEEESKED